MSKKLINVVLDLETLSTSSDACIIQIGAAVPHFDYKHVLGYPIKFESTIAYEQCQWMIKQGVVSQDNETMEWWKDQSSRKEVFSGQSTYLESLEQFVFWIDCLKSTGAEVALWGNGSDFDNVILKHSLEVFNLHDKFSFRNNRCLRTMKTVFPLYNFKRYTDHLAHTALGDALHEARLLDEIYSTYELQEVL